MSRLDKALTDRWRGDAGEALVGAVLARLLAGRPLTDLGLTVHEGRVDLRGLPLPEPSRLGRFELDDWFVEELGGTLAFRNARLDGLDLGGARLERLRFESSSLSNCSFRGADCRGWRLWGTTVSDCDFAGANLRDAAVGTGFDRGARNEWRSVSFAGADLRVGAAQSADFLDCDFALAKVVNVTFAQCRFERGRFRGPVSRTVFDGRPLGPDRPAPPPMVDVDFTDAVFHDVTFRGCDLAHVKLPADEDLLVFRHWPCVLERALATLDGDPSTNARIARAVVANELRTIRTADEDGVINLRDFADVGDEGYGEFFTGVLRRAEAVCGP